MPQAIEYNFDLMFVKLLSLEMVVILFLVSYHFNIKYWNKNYKVCIKYKKIKIQKNKIEFNNY